MEEQLDQREVELLLVEHNLTVEKGNLEIRMEDLDRKETEYQALDARMRRVKILLSSSEPETEQQPNNLENIEVADGYLSFSARYINS